MRLSLAEWSGELVRHEIPLLRRENTLKILQHKAKNTLKILQHKQGESCGFALKGERSGFEETAVGVKKKMKCERGIRTHYMAQEEARNVSLELSREVKILHLSNQERQGTYRSEIV